MHPMSRQNSRHSIPAEPEVTFGKRMVSTAEVMVSKIFPAGFGWQGASVVAENAGFDGASLNFALTTGAGDFLGVLTGHTLYMAVKKGVTGNDDINMTHEAQTGLLLGSAAFCSGTVWQPIVNFAQSIGLGFNGSAGLTLAVCGGAFFAGLRGFRILYSPIMEGVEENNYSNLKNDAALSLSIGAATACFVGTDVSTTNAGMDMLAFPHLISRPLRLCCLNGDRTGALNYRDSL